MGLVMTEEQRNGPVGREKDLHELEVAIEYEFDDRRLLERALTHRSFANEQPGFLRDNQRLEFLGDAVLGVVIAEALFLEDEKAPEGALSSQLSELVCEPALVERAQALDLGSFLRLGRGEELTGGRSKEGLLADAYEALLGAVFLDGGHQAAQEVILAQHAEAIEAVVSGEDGTLSKSPGDFKSLLQRKVQGQRPVRPNYRLAEVLGPPHERRFVSEVLVEEQVLGVGEGTSKKAAEQAAAAEAVAFLDARGGDWRSDDDDSLADGSDSE